MNDEIMNDIETVVDLVSDIETNDGLVSDIETVDGLVMSDIEMVKVPEYVDV